MTATTTEGATATQKQAGAGRVSRIIGPVIDVEFPADAMPAMYNLLTVDVELSGETKTLNLEVAQHIGDNMVRAISLQPTDGVVRGAPVKDSGGPITVPVGDVTLGHVFNTTGDTVDEFSVDEELISEGYVHPVHMELHLNSTNCVRLACEFIGYAQRRN